VQNLNALNEVIAQGAKPWWTIYGGKDNIEVVG
jgi:tagatose 1,6-diphosphate aldolase